MLTFIKNFLKNNNFRNKLILYFLFVIILLEFLLGGISSFIYSKTIQDEATGNTGQMIQKVNENLEFYISKMEETIHFISKSPAVGEFIKINDWNAANRVDAETEVRKILRSVKESYPEILGILVLNENDLYVSNEMYRIKRNPLIKENWYKDSASDPSSIHLYSKPIGRNLANSLNYTSDDVVSLVKAFKDPTSGKCLGVIVIDMSLNTVKTVIEDIKIGEKGFVYVADSNGDIVYTPLNNIIYRMKKEWIVGNNSNTVVRTINNEKYQVLISNSNYTGWKTVGVFSLNEALKTVNDLRLFIIVIGILTSLLAISMAIIFAGTISKPVSKLRKLMKQAEGGNLDVHFESKSEDEIGQLGKSFNNMISEIKKLLSLVYTEQKSKREAEIRILQAQIKPHFLYNTLDNIQWMALRYGAEDIVEVINALTTLFRIGLSKGKELIQVREEIEHIKSYLLIQKVRYAHLLNYEIHIDESLMNYLVLKITLQPIIENAIYHGIKELDEGGNIIVSGEIIDNKLHFTITDNGPGIISEKLEEINKMLCGEVSEAKKVGYGIYNVNERIKLSYGSEYGIKINSMSGKGTVVEIFHPMIEKE